jgi:hypothetical protein
MIVMEPEFTTSILSDRILFVEDSRDIVVLTDCHYKMMNERLKPVMICRNC